MMGIRRAKNLGTAGTATPAGVLAPFAGQTAPQGWFLCYGQEVAISSAPELYGVLGTLYGALTNGAGAPGSTHFRLPDLRGRTIAGRDNMGGSAASRLTSEGSGVPGQTLGATGGSETHLLTSAQSGVPAHQHANTLSNNTVASASHRHEFKIALNDNFYAATGTNAAMGNSGSTNAGAYRYSNGSYSGGTLEAQITDTRRDAGTASAGASARFSSTGDTTTSSNQTVGISNANNNASNASAAHNNTQPTIVLNYIIKG